MDDSFVIELAKKEGEQRVRLALALLNESLKVIDSKSYKLYQDGKLCPTAAAELILHELKSGS